MFRNGKWHFKALVEPSAKRWRVVSADGRTEIALVEAGVLEVVG